MREHLNDILKPILLTAAHFGSVYFAVTALAPSFALAMALIAAMVAIAGYLFLLLTDSTDRGLPAGILYFAMPVMYGTLGVIWWLLRLVGLWPPPF